MSKWTIDQFNWTAVDAAGVSPDLLKLIKTASLVEYNSADYTAYLNNVFKDDEEFKSAAEGWGVEERQHGLALKKWAEIVDPTFDFDTALAKFTAAFRVNVNAQTSVRGSLGRELVARCVVESGTTSFYSALRDATTDPVLKEICHWIAMDEIKHFNLFHKFFNRYQPKEKLRIWDRARVILQRSGEVDDEELSFAFAAANYDGPIDPNRLKEYSHEYLRKAYSIYRPKHLAKALALLFRASGIQPHQWLIKVSSRIAHRLLQRRTRKLELSNAA